jgi:hypothetical protein
MKFKKLTLLPLLLILPMLRLTAQQSQTNSSSSENVFGIDLNRTYSGNEVLNLLTIMDEEAQTSITKAYNEGYKAGVLEYKPETIKLQSLNDSLKADAEQMRKQYAYTIPQWQVPLWAAGGLLFGYGLRCVSELIK